ncbi:hypothetical protein TWF281_002968 [Arthrobotrys megalospora]
MPCVPYSKSGPRGGASFTPAFDFTADGSPTRIRRFWYAYIMGLQQYESVLGMYRGTTLRAETRGPVQIPVRPHS